MEKTKAKSAVEEKSFLYHLTNTLVEKKCYIKSYGKLFRVMDERHNPEINIKPKQFQFFLFNGIVAQKGDVWCIAVTKNPFKNFNEINLSLKQKQNAAV